FFLVAGYSPREARKQKLARVIASSNFDSAIEPYLPKAEWLIVRDEEETGTRFGQQVRETFHLADVFIHVKDASTVESAIRRFIQLIFGHPFHTPTPDELSMYLAKAVALRSADLSRQVGAIITGSDGSVLASGCNEVPKAGGGAYWCGDENDHRDF